MKHKQISTHIMDHWGILYDLGFCRKNEPLFSKVRDMIQSKLERILLYGTKLKLRSVLEGVQNVKSD